MGRKKQSPPPINLTPQRAARLYKFLAFLDAAPQTRSAIVRKLRIDTRGFYRDLEAIRGLGIAVEVDERGRYALAARLDDALSRFPLPDPGLNVREALQLAQGSSATHLKLRKTIDAFLKGARPAKPGLPR